VAGKRRNTRPAGARVAFGRLSDFLPLAGTKRGVDVPWWGVIEHDSCHHARIFSAPEYHSASTSTLVIHHDLAAARQDPRA
jgi:hypothetical protein